MNSTKTKSELFIELANPDKNGFSRWVNTTEFTGKYSSLELLNGFSWGRRSSSIAQKYIIEIDRTITKSNKIDRIKLNGLRLKKENRTQSIRSDIVKEILKKRCVILGTNRSCDHNTEVDHKDGRKDNIRIMNTKTQKLEDFQPLSKPANDAKRQFCKECRQTNKRYDAKQLGYTVSFTKGNIRYEKNIGCEGCYWYDPIAFRQKLYFKKNE